MSSITVTYSVNPPAGTTLPTDVLTSRTLEVAVDAPIDNQKTYYGALHEALAEARNKLGADLTIWRDAAGKLELNKEAKKGKKVEDEQDEEDEQEEEE